jgi:hypothetical protein
MPAETGISGGSCLALAPPSPDVLASVGMTRTQYHPFTTVPPFGWSTWPDM